MTKYVISGYIGFDNFGDEAIAGVLTSYLKNKEAEKITVLSSNPAKTSHLYGITSVGMLKFIKPILEADVLISGGGSLLQDVTSLKSLLYYLAVIMFALACGKKVIIFAQGFTPFRTKIGKILTKFVLKRCYKISVRDSKSQAFLHKIGIESKLITDPVYGISIPNKEKAGIGIQLRGIPQGISEEFLDSIAEYFQGKEVKLISLQDSIDLPVLEKLASKMNVKIIKNLDIQSAIEELSSLEYIIAMRFHACLCAAKAGVKVLAINYDVKVENLAEEVGFPIINLNETDFSKLETAEPENYRIPHFSFEDLID